MSATMLRPWVLLGELGQLVFAAGHGHYFGALQGQQQGNGPANAAAGAGDDGNLVGEVGHGCSGGF